ncbi:MAG TPA: TMEM165/GDT1 family protein [Terriglobales bacterium]|nr:TMEM165/GDT1 family protein [Terriglobales bacterium]
MFDVNSTAFLTVAIAIFVAELADKDAFLLLTLATRRRAWFVFFAGSTAFAITTAIIITFGYLILTIVPVLWIKLAGGAIMIGYGFWQLSQSSAEELGSEKSEVLSRATRKNVLVAFLTTVAMLAFLDLAGDATEILTIIFLARFRDAILVFVAALSALIAATAVETFLGTQLRRFLSPKRLRLFSVFVFLTIGVAVIITTVLW